MMLVAIAAVAAAVAADQLATGAAGRTGSVAADGVVLVTGATGRTGSLVYNALRNARGPHGVRALVRHRAKARKVLDCTECDEADGVFVGDVTHADDLEAPFAGVASAVILTSSMPYKLANGSWTYPPGGSPREVDWLGQDNQVAAARRAGAQRVVLVSSMGTTQPDSPLDKLGGGYALFYKAQGELSLLSSASALNFTIVKPAGLLDEPGGRRRLLVGRNDELARNRALMTVPRADVAALVVAALDARAPSNLRFDLASDPAGPPTTDLRELLTEARRLW